MAKQRRTFVCRSCGAETPAWTGQCTGCDGWATIEEVVVGAGRQRAVAPRAVAPLSAFDGSTSVPNPVGIAEVDRVLGGGLVAGSVTLLSGEPGIGKSTLTLQVACSVASTGAGVVLVTGEEAPAQVAARASRMGAIPPSLVVLDDTSVDTIVSTLSVERPAVAVIDSIQTLRVGDLDASPGSVSQVREAAARLVEVAKAEAISLVLIGHVTKDGALAGPRLLEHVVDTVLSFSGDRHHDLRFLRAVKHRFGPTTDVGLFEMGGLGLEAVADPSGRFLADRRLDTAGSMVVPALDGHRPVLVEVQALASPHGDRPAAIQTEGLSASRAKLVCAVLEQRAAVSTFGQQVFVSAAGGASILEPGADLGLALAIASSVADRPFPADLVACGEVGLSGEVRSVPQLERRLAEAFRLGFRTAIVPMSAGDGPTGMRLVRVGTVTEAVARLPKPVGVPF